MYAVPLYAFRCFGIPLGTVADKVWGTYPAGKLIDHLYEWPAVRCAQGLHLLLVWYFIV